MAELLGFLLRQEFGSTAQGDVPEISRFFGIVVTINYGDHPPPHVHVRHGSDKATLRIDTLSVYEGRLSPRALGLLIEWASQHRDELRVCWEQAARNQPVSKIHPLE